MTRFDLSQLSNALFEEAQDALFLFDPETDRILEVNAMAEYLSGFPREKLVGVQWPRLIGSERRGRNRLRSAADDTGVFHSQEGYFLRTQKDGQWIPVNVTLTRL